jgi:hypothetical protein
MPKAVSSASSSPFVEEVKRTSLLRALKSESNPERT